MLMKVLGLFCMIIFFKEKVLADIEVLLGKDITIKLGDSVSEYLVIPDKNEVRRIFSLMCHIALWAGFLSTDAFSRHIESIVVLKGAEEDINTVVFDMFNNETIKALQDYPPQEDMGLVRR